MGSFTQKNWREWDSAEKEDRSTWPRDAYLVFSDAPLRHGRSTIWSLGPYKITFVLSDASGAPSDRFVGVIEAHFSPDQKSAEVQSKTKTDSYTGSTDAQELLSLLGLENGISIWCPYEYIGSSLPNDDFAFFAASSQAVPKHGEPDPLRHRMLPFLGDRALEQHRLTEAFPEIEPESAVCIARAAYSYQRALRFAGSDPEASWLLLVSAAETCATHCDIASPLTELERLYKRAETDNHLSFMKDYGEDLPSPVVEYLAKMSGPTQKFAKFLEENFPNAPFWADESDVSWNAPAEVIKGAKTIYRHRSYSLHSGEPFPAPLLKPRMGHEKDKPRYLAATTLGGTWAAKDLPMYLHAFEHLVRGAILRFWQRQIEIARAPSALDDS